MKEPSKQQKGPAPGNSGKYLYAVAQGAIERDYPCSGVNEGRVYSIVGGQVAMVVSDVPNESIRPERRHLAAHQAVIKKLMEESTVLPMAFGVIADSTKAIKQILSRDQETFLGQLNRVADKVEMGVRVMWDVPNIFEYFVNTHIDLKIARDRLFSPRHEPSQEDKIEIGRMFERMLNEDRETHAQKVEKALSTRCFEIKRGAVRSEREVMNLACLVSRNHQKQFEEGVFEAARLFSDEFAFDFNGPWAPHNFTEINLKI